MSVAWYIVLERQVPSLKSFVSGKSLPHADKILDALAARAGVRPLMKFFSVSPAELAGFGVTGKTEASPEQWFAAEEGLETVRALLLEAETEKVEQRVLDDLREFDRVLGIAQQNGVRWHLAVDF